jgi:hypothetical protein
MINAGGAANGVWGADIRHRGRFEELGRHQHEHVAAHRHRPAADGAAVRVRRRQLTYAFKGLPANATRTVTMYFVEI